MTVLADKVTDVAYAKNNRSFTISSYEQVRDNASHNGIVLKDEYVIVINSDGSFTTPDLDPGYAIVTFSRAHSYNILIPVSSTPVRIWPLIQANLPAPPSTPFGQFVANGGNANRIQVVSQAEYSALVTAGTPDPGSIFAIY